METHVSARPIHSKIWGLDQPFRIDAYGYSYHSSFYHETDIIIFLRYHGSAVIAQCALQPYNFRHTCNGIKFHNDGYSEDIRTSWDLVYVFKRKVYIIFCDEANL